MELAEPYPTSPSILVIEDDRRIAAMLQATLQLEGFATAVAHGGEEGVTEALRSVPELILLDIMLPDIDGFEVANRLRGHPKTAHIPVVVLSARHDTESKVRAFACQVDDYLTKPFSGDELLARIRVRLSKQDTQRSPLTGLPAGQRIEKALTQQLRSGATWALLYFDLDHFKAFNDVYGFIQGNRLIELMAHIATEVLRDAGDAGDFLGHIGGDDFIIITSPSRITPICQALIAAWSRQSRVYYSADDLARGTLHAKDRQGRPTDFPLVSVSIGVATNLYQPITTIEQVSHIAAEVKAKAKAMPGNSFYVDQRGAIRDD